MKMRKLFAGLAAAATLLGGLALGASTANAVDTNVVPNDAKWPTADNEYPQTGTTITIKASNKEQLQNRKFRLYKLADYIYYQGQNVEADNPVKGSVGLQTVGWNADSSKTSAAYKKIQDAVAAATANNDTTNQYAPKDASDKPVNRPDDPLAWAAQADLKAEPNPSKSNGRIDQSPTSPWTGLTRQLAEAFNLDDFATGSDKIHHGTGTDNGKAFEYYDAIVNVSTPQQATDGTYYVTVSGLDRGLYFITDATTSTYDNNAGYTNSLRMIVGTKLYLSETQKLSEGEIDLKNQTLPIHKQVVKYDGTSNTSPDFNIGSTVSYELTTTIPVYTGYEKDADHPYGYDENYSGKKQRRILQVADTMSKGLTYQNVASVTVTPKNGKSVTLKSESGEGNNYKANDYKVTTEDTTYSVGQGSNQIPSDTTGTNHIIGAAAKKITIDLGGYVNQAAGSSSENNGILEGAEVKVILRATLNKDAVISTPDAANGNPNKVDLIYSNSPENLEDKTTVPGGEVNVYTFKFQLLKYAKDAGKNLPLEGAEFKIKQGNKYLVKTEKKDKGAVTDISWGTQGDATVFTSDKDGKVTGLDGLAATDSNGTAIKYTVEETKAPTGYQNAILPSFTFTITPTYKQDTSTKKDGATTWGDHTVEVKDGKPSITFSTDDDDAWSLVSKDETTTFQYR